jgi:16S rRNA processing protein RimM
VSGHNETQARSTGSDDLVEMGRINGLYGVRGWVKVYSHTRPPEGLLRYRSWLVSAGETWQPRRVAEGRLHGKGIVVRLQGCEDRDAAEALLGARIAVQRDRLPRLDAGEYYWTDLIGLEVETLEGIDLGRVSHLIETGANDVLVVRGDRERLIPFLPGRFVHEIDLDRGRMRVDWDPSF